MNQSQTPSGVPMKKLSPQEVNCEIPYQLEKETKHSKVWKPPLKNREVDNNMECIKMDNIWQMDLGGYLRD